MGEIGIAGHRPDVLQVKDISPSDSETAVAPGKVATFTLLQSRPPHIVDFEDDAFPSWWLNCNPSNGFSESSWNGSADNLDIYDDDGNKVLRMQGRGTAIADENWQSFASNGNRIDVRLRVKWHTGAEAGFIARCRFDDSYSKETNGIDCVWMWIDSGGFRWGWISGGTPGIEYTDSFSPVDGTWYWLRIQIHLSASRFRAKRWTGDKADEPGWGTWRFPSHGKDQRDHRWKGIGIHCRTGTAYFDVVENVLMGDEDYPDRLTVEVNGDPKTVATGNLRVHPIPFYETWETYDGPTPDITEWLSKSIRSSHSTTARPIRIL